MTKTKTDLIIESFEKMDVGMLDMLLDDNKTYQEATKEVFLEKVREAFSEFKKRDDTFLVAHQGLCVSDFCANTDCIGYSFVGNKSKKHIDLIFREEENDVKDIFHCHCFQTNDETLDRERLISIEIKRDELPGFKPGIEFLIQNQKCQLAYEELIQHQNTIIDKDVYSAWLEKFYPLYKSFDSSPFSYSAFYKFYSLYEKMNQIAGFLKSSHSPSIEAVEEFQNIDNSNESQLLKWLVKYENSANKLTLNLYDDIDLESPEKTDYFEVENLKICSSDFKDIIKFELLFNKYYWKLLEKYNTFSDEDVNEIMAGNSKMWGCINSLSYHLEKRGIDLK